MKKILHRTLLATTVLAIAGAGCVNENREHHDPIVKLAFDPVMHAQVRSSDDAENPDTDTESDTFGVSAWYLDEETPWSEGAANAVAFLPTVRLLRNGSLWYPETVIDWPSKQYTVACIGFSPYDAADACDLTDGVVFRSVDTSDDPGDLRYTEPRTGLTKNRNGGIVVLPMLPALCEVEFRVRGVTGYEATKVHVRRITLNGVCLKGEFRSLPEPLWTPDRSPESLTFFEGDLQAVFEPQEAGTARRLIPQQLNGTVTVEYEFEAPSETRLQQVDTTEPVKRNLEAGRRYIFTLAISPAGVEILSETPVQNE